MALADASTDETAPPYPVEVDGAGGVGRPVPTAEAVGPAAGAAEAGAPTPTIPSAKAAVDGDACAADGEAAVVVDHGKPPEVVTSGDALTVDPCRPAGQWGCVERIGGLGVARRS